ncbi:MAG: branched-chain amino acid ABC transporter permease [Fidelibacterota bacterium]
MVKGRYEEERLVWIPILLLLFLVLPFVLRGTTISFRYYLYVLNLAGIYTILVIGLDLLSGYTGLISLGHAAFFAIGAYTSALLVDQAGVPFGWSLVITPIISGLSGFIIGFPALRVSGMYLGLTTMGFGFIVTRLIIAFRRWTGGASGLEVSSPVLFGHRFQGYWENYYLILASVVLAVVVARRIVRSKIGRAFMAVRDLDETAAAVGVNLAFYKMLSFFISGVYAGFAGVLFAHTTHFITTDHFNILLSIYFIVMVLVGGMGSVYGAVVGTLFIVLLDNLFVPLVKDWLGLVMHAEAGDLQALMFGLIMLLMIIFQPQGIYGMWLKVRLYWRLFPFNPRKRLT